MEQRFSGSTELEISFNTTSPQFSDFPELRTSTSSPNFIYSSPEWQLYSTSSPNFIYSSPEWQLYSLENGEPPFCSDFRRDDTPQQGELCPNSLLQVKETNTLITGAKSGDEEVVRSFLYGERIKSSTFVKWKDGPRLPSLQPQKSQALHKRCISLLNCINDHRISPLHDNHGGRRVNHDYDKLAIHHVVAERKRREQMKEIFSSLCVLLPRSPKKGRAAVLLETIDYVGHLKKRVEQLERRNGELEALLHEKSGHDLDNVSHIQMLA